MLSLVKRVCAPGILFLLLAFGLLVPGCSGSSAEIPNQPINAAADKSAAPVEAAANGLPELPAPSAIERGASLVETGLVVHGGSFRADLTNQNVSRLENNALFDPDFTSGQNPLYSKVALAIYSFDISSVAADELDLLDFDVDGIPDLVIGTAHVYAGWPAQSMDKWEWSELTQTSSSGGSSSFSWGMSNPGNLSSRTNNGILNVCVVIYGDTAVDVSRVALAQPGISASPRLLFSRGWDGTYKGPIKKFGSSVAVDGDAQGRVHATCYDSSNGQLYYIQAANRVVREMCVDCYSSSGLSNDLCLMPDGRLFLAYTDDNLHQGACKWMAPESLSSMIWSPRSNFDSGEDPTGALSSVGSQCRCVCDDGGAVHVFNVDETNNQIKHAWQNPDTGEWQSEFVSPPGEVASCPAPMRSADGVCCAYLSRSSGGGGGGGGAVYLRLAQQDADGWYSDTLADDVRVPDYLDPDDDCDGFCDGSVMPGTDTAVLAYSSSSGVGIVHRDLATRNTLLSSSLDRSSSSGAFLRLAMCGDGSVRLLHYDGASKTVYFENGDVPAGEDFVSTAVLVYDGKDNDCDGIDFWVDPDSDHDGLHEVVITDLSSSVSSLTGVGKKEFKGHVTLMK